MILKMQIAIVLFIATGCTHYAGMQPQYIKGNQHSSKLSLDSCENYWFGLTPDAGNATFAKALDKLKLTPDQIYSTDWYYWNPFPIIPIYYARCLQVSVNENYRGHIPIPEAAPDLAKMQIELKSCEALNFHAKSNCKKEILKKYGKD